MAVLRGRRERHDQLWILSGACPILLRLVYSKWLALCSLERLSIRRGSTLWPKVVNKSAFWFCFLLPMYTHAILFQHLQDTANHA
jgi:hypothetical protein